MCKKKKTFMLVLLIFIFAFSMPAFAALKLNSDKDGYISPKGYVDNPPKYNFPTNIYIPNLQSDVAIHSNYKKNKDACASCHSTHTAVGVSLLQWADVSDTCMVCHDGTVTITYDVRNGQFYDKTEKKYVPSNGGLFSKETTDKSMSMHDVFDGELKNSAAPGGTDKPYKVDGVTVAWDVTFTCASCHNPHGAGGNARLLNQNPNGIGERSKIEKGDGIQVYKVNNNNNLEWAVYPDLLNDNDPDREFKGNQFRALTFITVYPYDTEIHLYKRPNNNGETFSVDKLTLISSNSYDIDNSEGFTKFVFKSDPSAADAGSADGYILYIEGVPGLSVGMRINKYLKVGEEVEYKYGINEFCAACHEDYNTATKKFFIKDDTRYFMQFSAQSGYYSGSGGKKQDVVGDGKSGTYASAFRHQVGMVWEMRKDMDETINALRFQRDPWDDRSLLDDGYNGKYIVNCLTCHVAHGVSEDYWERTIGKIIVDPSETNQDSALKRLPDMAVCEACHQKWKDNEGYMQNVERTYDDLE